MTARYHDVVVANLAVTQMDSPARLWGSTELALPRLLTDGFVADAAFVDGSVKSFDRVD